MAILTAAMTLTAFALPAAAIEPERDAWMLDDAGKAQPLGKHTDPETFRRIKSTGNDLEPEYANVDQLALVQAVEQGDRPRIETLLKKAVNPNRLTGFRGKTALIQAVARDDIEVTRLLLDAGADPDTKSGDGYTPLGLAALRGDAQIVKLLLKAGANPDLKSSDGNTPLTAAASLNRLDAIRALLAARPDPTLFNREGRTALSVAASEGYEEAVRLMLEAKVDPNVRDRNGSTALAATMFGDYKSIQQLLVNYGASSL